MLAKRKSFFGSPIMLQLADEGETLLQKSASEGTKIPGAADRAYTGRLSVSALINHCWIIYLIGRRNARVERD
jgi:hypothetical protein